MTNEELAIPSETIYSGEWRSPEELLPSSPGSAELFSLFGA
jgi:hypothetical protein